MKLKNLLLSGLSLVLVAALAIGGTVAYLQDDDSDVNVMTLGNVSIEQIEQERDENGNLVDFKQAKPAYPVVGPIAWDNEQLEVNGGEYKVFTDELKNVVDKIVTVNNTGKSDAYVRTIVAIEAPEGDPNNLIHFNWNNSGVELEGGFVTKIDGIDYYIITFVYTDALASGAKSAPSLMQVFLDSKATNEDCAKFGESWEILVKTQAVQAAGFADAKTALKAAFGDITTTNHPWSVEAPVIPVVVEDADGLVEALESGKDVVLNNDVKIEPAGMSNAYGTTGINVKNGQTIDGNGNTLDIKGAGGTWDSGINTTGGLIKNLTVTGSFRGIFINHNSSHSEPVVLENVIIDGTTYTISCDQGMNQNFEAYNSTFNGWTSYAATLGNAKFENCKFGEGNGNAFCRPYAPTTFVGCEFEAGYKIDARAAVTFENCTIGGVALTADNLATLVAYNTQNASVK